MVENAIESPLVGNSKKINLDKTLRMSYNYGLMHSERHTNSDPKLSMNVDSAPSV
tara:strand:- start:338 stop:502 length:165 start_codon:yes stop_codon:yes gene_type:complete